MKTEEVSCHSAPRSSWDLMCLQRLSGIARLELCTNLALADSFFNLTAHAGPKDNIFGFPQTGFYA